MRIDIPFQMMKEKSIPPEEEFRLIAHYEIIRDNEVYFRPHGGWNLIHISSMVCLFGPCFYSSSLPKRYDYGVPWMGVFISVEDWLTEIGKVLERMS